MRPPEARSRQSIPPVLRGAGVAFFLYLFLVGVGLLEEGISAMGAGFQEGLLREVANPISGLCAGILATVLVQSSSVTTATIVGLVGSGTLPVSLAVPMVMGANIGTTVTNTLASLGSIRRADEFRRAFAAATVHDFFNLIAVAVLFPVELATGFLSRIAGALTAFVRGAGFDPTQPGRSPIRQAVKMPIDWVEGFFQHGPLVGVLFLLAGLFLIFLSLALITRNMRRLVVGSVERVMNRAIGSGGGQSAFWSGSWSPSESRPPRSPHPSWCRSWHRVF